MKTAVAYLRVSTAQQVEEGLSLDAQKARLEAYCLLNGLQLVEVIVEAGVSASKNPLAKREGGARVVELANTGAVEHIIGLKLDRMFRNVVDCLHNISVWDKAGISLHFLDFGGGAMNVSSAIGRMMVTIVAAFAEMEAGLVSERTKMALQFKKSQGAKLGQPEFGSCDEEIEAVQLMMGMRAEGSSFRDIAAHMTANGYATKRGGKWGSETVRKIICRN